MVNKCIPAHRKHQPNGVYRPGAESDLSGAIPVAAFLSPPATRSKELRHGKPKALGISDPMEAHRLFAHLSHEVRTPLNVILGAAEVVEAGYAGPLTESQRGYLRDIRMTGVGLIKQLENLLDIAAIRSGNFPIDPDEVNFFDISANLVEATRGRRAEKQIALEVGHGYSNFNTDKRALLMALVNIVGSACDRATYRGTISLSAERTDTEVQILMTDDSVPPPQELIDMVCGGGLPLEDPYLRAVDRPLGLQLELPIARDLIVLLGGRFSVSRNLGTGSTKFLIQLPFRET